mgnify:CR=1 FL=1
MRFFCALHRQVYVGVISREVIVWQKIYGVIIPTYGALRQFLPAFRRAECASLAHSAAKFTSECACITSLQITILGQAHSDLLPELH